MGRFMKADMKLNSVQDIDPAELRKNGIRGILFDIDNTLEEYNTKKPGEKCVALIKKLSQAGFRIGILSNAKKKRAEQFVDGFPKNDFPEIVVVSDAGKPLRSGFRKLLSKMGVEAKESVMVGDQLYTDILGGNCSGLRTILVKPINLSAEPRFVRFKRLIEKPFM